MKFLLLRSLVLAVTLVASTFAASRFQSFELALVPGSSPAVVQKTLGAPSAKMGSDLWVYFNFAQSNPNVDNPAFDTLVVAFAENRVVAVKVTDGRVVRKLLAEYQAQLAASTVAAK
jgi:hypothetical protein